MKEKKRLRSGKGSRQVTPSISKKGAGTVDLGRKILQNGKFHKKSKTLTQKIASKLATPMITRQPGAVTGGPVNGNHGILDVERRSNSHDPPRKRLLSRNGKTSESQMRQVNQNGKSHRVNFLGEYNSSGVSYGKNGKGKLQRKDSNVSNSIKKYKTEGGVSTKKGRVSSSSKRRRSGSSRGMMIGQSGGFPGTEKLRNLDKRKSSNKSTKSRTSGKSSNKSRSLGRKANTIDSLILQAAAQSSKNHPQSKLRASQKNYRVPAPKQLLPQSVNHSSKLSNLFSKTGPTGSALSNSHAHGSADNNKSSKNWSLEMKGDQKTPKINGESKGDQSGARKTNQIVHKSQRSQSQAPTQNLGKLTQNGKSRDQGASKSQDVKKKASGALKGAHKISINVEKVKISDFTSHPKKKRDYPNLNHIRKNQKSLPFIDKSKVIVKKFGSIQGFSVNTHVGTVRDYNEDRVSILLNAQQR